MSDDAIEPSIHVERAQRELRRARLAALSMLTLTLAAMLALVIVWLSRPRLPDSVASRLPPGAAHQVDIVLLDAPTVDSQFIEDAVRPMLMVAERHLPGQPQHLRIVLSGEGFPMNVAADGIAAAAYLPDDDSFVVDVQHLMKLRPARMSTGPWIALATAHEAMHLVQARRGQLAHHVSHFDDPQAYFSDPIEIEAYQEGLTVATALAGRPVRWTFRNGRAIEPAMPNPYWDTLGTDLLDRADVRVSRQSTPLGVWRWLRAWICS